ncbi:nucleoside kinase [uncultured Thomasclavelia sp.]|uniref:nucleoside kinase n=1 Tax=uncultured Thomasclavelia sp. TaxID=3025759 RepID=UPI0026113F7C|nr:nucleoside kinase [uncultured Thomasclavelia sp.]
MKLIVDKQIININQTTTLEQIAKEYFINQKIYAGIVNGKLKPLQEIIDKDTTIEWVLASSITGKQIYERTLTFLFIVATKQLFNDAKITVEFTFQDGLYCTIEKENHLTPKDVEKIKLQMQKLVTKKSKITHCSLPKEEAINFFKQHGLEDKAELLHYRKKENCSVYTLEGFSDYFYGFMLPDTSYLNHFSLQFFAPGIRLGQYDVQLEYSKLFTIMKEYEDWGQLIGVPTVAKLNEKIVQGNINELMLMSEAMIEKKLAELAYNIVQRKDTVKIILIAGPSSAGKTTFSKRLGIHLKILGMQPVTLSMDDFYLNRKDTPKLPNGSYDYENIEAVDLKLFNETMLKLIYHEPVCLPRYNFKTGLREYNDQEILLKEGQILIIEGIHGLNPRTSFYIPNTAKIKIYINALTHLNYDDHNRITTSDYRLIRRIVRDFQFRNSSAKETISRWQNVKNGEDKYIYPYQEEADYIFNTSMVYELAILKPIAQKLLSQIGTGEKEYLEANRLNKLLDYFVSAKVEVPQVSILAEFVGNSIFE